MKVISGEAGDSKRMIGMSVMKAKVRFERFATLPPNYLSCLRIMMLMKLSMIVGTIIGKIADAGDRQRLMMK